MPPKRHGTKPVLTEFLPLLKRTVCRRAVAQVANEILSAK
jgi:hypothetical protein